MSSPNKPAMAIAPQRLPSITRNLADNCSSKIKCKPACPPENQFHRDTAGDKQPPDRQCYRTWIRLNEKESDNASDFSDQQRRRIPL